MTTLLLVDDHPIFLAGLRRVLEAQEDLKIVGEAETIACAVEHARELRPDVVVLDLGLGDGSGLDALPRLLEVSPRSQVIVLTGYGDERELPALRAGARGFVKKDVASSQVLQAIRAVRRGEIWARRRPAGQLLDELAQRERVGRLEGTLTPREQEVLRLVGEGKRNQEIARELSISEHTVKTHISSLLRKLGMEDRLHLALYASRSVGEEP